MKTLNDVKSEFRKIEAEIREHLPKLVSLCPLPNLFIRCNHDISSF